MKKKIVLSSACFLLFCLLISNVNAVENHSQSIKMLIDNQEYDVELENNPTSKEFVNLLPQEYTMVDLNHNEKYVNLNATLTSNPTVSGQINAGDIMLYQDNCIVLFYDTFNTSYKYTKIGHVNNLKKPGVGDIQVKFIKS